MIHSSVIGHLGFFQSLAIVNFVAVDSAVQVTLLRTLKHSQKKAATRQKSSQDPLCFLKDPIVRRLRILTFGR
jgi:hypothetical protein